MKKTILIVALAVMGLAGYFAAHILGGAACPEKMDCNPIGMQWLKQEFQLNQAQYEKIRALHESYASECCARCCELMAAQKNLARVLNSNNSITPEVSAALERLEKAGNESRRTMLRHIYAVSREMNPGQGRRFVEMMSRHLGADTCASGGSADSQSESCH